MSLIEQVSRPPTLPTVVADSLRETILEGIWTGALAPGERLGEVALSESLGVSRGTLRVALVTLKDDGVVEIIPHRGTYVTRLSFRMASEIFSLRELLEPFAVRLAMDKNAYRERDLTSLERLVRRMGQLEQQGQALEATRADARYHFELCEPSGHQLALNALRRLQSRNMLYILHNKLYGWGLAPDEYSHGAVLQAIRAGDPERAAQVLKKHIHDSGQALLQGMKEKRLATDDTS